MVPLSKVQDLIAKHSKLEKELSSQEIDKKSFAEKSKEYSDLSDIIKEAVSYFGPSSTLKVSSCLKTLCCFATTTLMDTNSVYNALIEGERESSIRLMPKIAIYDWQHLFFVKYTKMIKSLGTIKLLKTDQ